MSKITKTKLARGTKLGRDHIYGPVKDADDELVAADLDEGNIKQYGSFRINWNIPYISGRWFDCSDYATTELGKPFRSVVIPFTLTPFQEDLDVDGNKAITGKPDPDESVFILDELSIGWDTRAEPRALRDGYNQIGWGGAGDLDDISYGGLGNEPAGALRQETYVAIWEKSNMTLDGGNKGFALKREVFSMSIAGLTLSSPDFRNNPALVGPINEVLSPFKTYALVIQCPFLDPRTKYPDENDGGEVGNDWFALHNVVCSMRVKTTLKSRLKNTGGTLQLSPTIQNIPRISNGAGDPPSASVTTPGAAGDISAEATTGVQTNITNLDEALNKKLDSGYSRESDRGVDDAIETQGCYEVICVPMFSNKDAIRRCDVLANTAGTNGNTYATNRTDPIRGNPDDFEDAGLPYTDGTSGTADATIDRRIIPIKYPMEIHHVIAHQNSFAPLVSDSATGALKPRSGYRHVYVAGGVVVTDITGVVPTTNTLVTGIGVAMGNGIRGEGYTYQNIAYCEFNHSSSTHNSVVSKNEFVIDRIQHIDGYVQDITLPDSIASNDTSYQHELISVPLLGNGTSTGKGWHATGNSNNYKQGVPVFVGQGNSNTAGYLYNASANSPGRSSMGSDTPWQQVTGAGQANLAPGHCKGAEQFIEVRWSIYDSSNNLHQPSPEAHGGGAIPAYNAKQQEVLVGAGGHWVYIIGKKLLAGDMSAQGE